MLRGDHRAKHQQADWQIELSERNLLEEELAPEEGRKPHEYPGESRRSGRANSDSRTNTTAIAQVSVNQVTCANSLGTHVKGTIAAANAGKLELVVAVLGPVKEVVRKKMTAAVRGTTKSTSSER